jgi:hypothetical protein
VVVGAFDGKFVLPLARRGIHVLAIERNQPRHFTIEHHPGEGQVRGHPPGWSIDWKTYSPAFVEASHVAQLTEHVHWIGLIMATRP